MIASSVILMAFAWLWRRPSPEPSGVAADALRSSASSTPLPTPQSPPPIEIGAPSEPNPLGARDAGYAAIAALQRDRRFDAAADDALGSNPVIRRDLIIAAFVGWGTHEPEAALDRAIELPDHHTRTLALESVLTGWARKDPAELANVALRFPIGPERDAALTKALREWMHRDPWTAGDWILAHDAHVQATAERMFAADNR